MGSGVLFLLFVLVFFKLLFKFIIMEVEHQGHIWRSGDKLQRVKLGSLLAGSLLFVALRQVLTLQPRLALNSLHIPG